MVLDLLCVPVCLCAGLHSELWEGETCSQAQQVLCGEHLSSKPIMTAYIQSTCSSLLLNTSLLS